MDADSGIPLDILRFIQDCISRVPVIVIGSGASVAYGIAGMAQLATYLIDAVRPSAEEDPIWQEFKQELSDGVDLESALHKVELPDQLERVVIMKTKELIISKDIEIRERIVFNQLVMSLGKLVKHLNRTASPQIKIVTTNYDRLVEYAIEQAGIEYYTGFRGRYMQRFDGRLNKSRASSRVEVLKVHGSLDWYSNPILGVLSLPDSFQNNEDLVPVMVTPGKRKYEHTHDEPFRSLISRVDTLFSDAESLLIIGFGFNDIHIQPKLIEKMRYSQTPIIIISKKLTPKAIEFIKTNESSKILGIEESGSGSNLIFPNKDDVKISHTIWGLEEFLKTFT